MERWVQITDTHIGKEGEDTFGVDVRRNFCRVLDAAMALTPDRLVLTGDLAYRDPEPEAYQWISEKVGALEVPAIYLPGNHDTSESVIEHFGTEGQLDDGTIGFAHQVGSRIVVFVDTARSELSECGATFLAEQLQQADGDPVVFIHHPPALAGVPYMDENHALKNHEEVLGILTAAARPISVFCGHYHVEGRVRCGNVDIFLTPSTFFQLSSRSNEFEVDHRRPGFRWIELDESSLRTGVSYLDET